MPVGRSFLMSLKHYALKSMIVSAITTAAIAVGIVLFGEFSSLAVKVLVTTFVVSASSLCVLSNAANSARHPNSMFGLVGALLSVLAGAMVLVGVWGEMREDFFWKLTGSACILGVCAAHYSLLSLEKFAPRFRLVRYTAGVLISTFAGLVIMVIFADTKSGDEILRVIAANAILIALVSILTPVFHKLSSADEREGDVIRSVTSQCPECAAPVTTAMGETTCSACECQFELRVIRHGSRSAGVANRL
jgi:hypothetical protein